MANNLNGLKADIRAAFGANLDAATRTNLLARFVTKYPQEWQAFLSAGNNDTAANRGVFASDMLLDKYLQDIYEGQRYREQVQAIVREHIQ